MNGGGKSDGPIVPRTPANNGGGNRFRDAARDPATASAERVEERGPPKGNWLRGPKDRTPSRATLQGALERIRQAATPGRQDPRQEPGAAVPHAGICPGGRPARGVPAGIALPILAEIRWRRDVAPWREGRGVGVCRRLSPDGRSLSPSVRSVATSRSSNGAFGLPASGSRISEKVG